MLILQFMISNITNPIKASSIEKRLPVIPILGREIVAQIISYGLMAVPAAIIDVCIYVTLIYIFGVHYLVALMVAFSVTSGLNYVLQKRFTFEEVNGVSVVQFNKFLTVGVISLHVNIIVAAIAVQYLMFAYVPARIVALLCAYLLSYAGNRLFTFTAN